ncbi:MAG TPA: hypothetical protein VK668_07080 [Mucilaginibacter sp.]|nr:hypothetical protein [Mucilaginibacter sp.]
MREIERPFEIVYEGRTVKVAEHELKNMRVFYIDFAGWKKPLTITVALNRFDEKFWTSVPEGRQKEAEELGKLIAGYIRNKRKESNA